MPSDKAKPPKKPRGTDLRRSDLRPATYLTQRQKEILDFISDYQRSHGIAPTHREIRDHFGYSSYGTVYKHLKLLQRKGFLHRDWNQKRGLELLRSVRGRPNWEAEVPFLGLIAAGQPIEALPGLETLAVPDQLFGGRPEDHYVLRVVGESMIQEGIHDGDFVVVLRRERAEAGEMVVALIGGVEATLKRFYPQGEKVRLQPANPNMQPIEVLATEVQVQGVVVGLMRKY
jgi:repressor LexA